MAVYAGSGFSLVSVRFVAYDSHVMPGFLTRLWSWLGFGPPDRDRFARQVLSAIVRDGRGPSLVYDREEFRLVGEGRVINLSNLYAEHCQMEKKDRANHVATIARFGRFEMPPIPNDFEAARASLRPKLWARQTIAMMALEAEARGDGPPPALPITLPVGRHLALSLVYDMADSVAFLTEERLHSWGVSLYQAMEIATENLEQQPMKLAGLGKDDKTPMAYSMLCGDTYDATRIVCKSKLEKLKVDGDLVACVPNRDSLLLTGSDCEAGLDFMLTMAMQLVREPRPLSPIPLRWTGEEWVDWIPEPDQPSNDGFREMQKQFLTNLFIDTQETLQAALNARGEDLFVAKVMSLELKSDGSDRTFCVWGEGVDSLLPETDLIAFMTGESALLAPWDEVRNLVGPMLEPADDYPVRYRTHGYPSETQFATIRMIAVD